MRRPGIDRKLDSDAGSSSRQKSLAPESAVAPAPTGEKMKKQRAAAAAVLIEEEPPAVADAILTPLTPDRS